MISNASDGEIEIIVLESEAECGSKCQAVDLSFEQHACVQNAGERAGKNTSKPKAPSKPRLPTVKKVTTAKIRKTKVEIEFEKLTPKDQALFLRNKLPLLPELEAKVEEGNNEMENIRCNETSESYALHKKAEDTLCSLRLELGSILAREAELRTQEKKLRLAIKREQRRIIMAQSPILCRTRETLPIVGLVQRLFSGESAGAVAVAVAPSDPAARLPAPAVQQHQPVNRLWSLAQQSYCFSQEVSARLLSIERDATLQLSADEVGEEEGDGGGEGGGEGEGEVSVDAVEGVVEGATEEVVEGVLAVHSVVDISSASSVSIASAAFSNRVDAEEALTVPLAARAGSQAVLGKTASPRSISPTEVLYLRSLCGDSFTAPVLTECAAVAQEVPASMLEAPPPPLLPVLSPLLSSTAMSSSVAAPPIALLPERGAVGLLIGEGEAGDGLDIYDTEEQVEGEEAVDVAAEVESDCGIEVSESNFPKECAVTVHSEAARPELTTNAETRSAFEVAAAKEVLTAPRTALFDQFAFKEPSTAAPSAVPHTACASTVASKPRPQKAKTQPLLPFLPMPAPAPEPAARQLPLPPTTQPITSSSFVVVDLTSPEAAPEVELELAPLWTQAQDVARPLPSSADNLPYNITTLPASQAASSDGSSQRLQSTPDCPMGVIHYIPSDEDGDVADQESGRGSCSCSQKEAHTSSSSGAQALARTGSCASLRAGAVTARPIVPTAATSAPSSTGAECRTKDSEESQISSASAQSDCSNMLNSPQQPDFSSMPVQRLREIVQHYGLKSDTKGRMVSLLRSMWQRLHTEGDSKSAAVSKVRYAQAVGAVPVPQDPSAFNMVSATGGSNSSVIPVVAAPGRGRPSSQSAPAAATGPARIVGEKRRAEVSAAEIVAFIKSCPELYEQVLSYAPLDLDKLHAAINAHFTAQQLQSQSLSLCRRAGSQQTDAVATGKIVGKAVSRARLLELLDAEAVFVSASQKRTKR